MENLSNNVVSSFSPRATIDSLYEKKGIIALTILFLIASIFAIIEFATVAANISDAAETINDVYRALESLLELFQIRIPKNSFTEIVDGIKVTLIISNALLPVSYLLLSIGSLVIIIGFKKDNPKPKKVGVTLVRIGIISFILYKLIALVCGIVEVSIILSVLGKIDMLKDAIGFIGFALVLMLILYPFVGLFFGVVFAIQVCFGLPLSYKHDKDLIGSPMFAGSLALAASFFTKINYMSLAVTFFRYSLMIAIGVIAMILAMGYHKARGNAKKVKMIESFKNVSMTMKEDKGVVLEVSEIGNVEEEKPQKEYGKTPISNEPIVETFPVVETMAVNIFNEDFKVIDKRYSVVNEEEFATCEAPIILNRYQFIKDKLSEKLLLRLDTKNNCEAGIKSILLSLKLRNGDGDPVGLIEAVEIENDNEKGLDFSIASVGVVLPNGTTTGEVIIKKITFVDGLSYDKEVNYHLSNKLQMLEDIESYINLHKVWED